MGLYHTAMATPCGNRTMKLCSPVATGPRTQESTIRGSDPQIELCSMSEQNHTTLQVLEGLLGEEMEGGAGKGEKRREGAGRQRLLMRPCCIYKETCDRVHGACAKG